MMRTSKAAGNKRCRSSLKGEVKDRSSHTAALENVGQDEVHGAGDPRRAGGQYTGIRCDFGPHSKAGSSSGFTFERG